MAAMEIEPTAEADPPKAKWEPAPKENIFFSDLPPSVTTEMIQTVFSPYGKIRGIRILTTSIPGGRRSALVQFSSLAEAQWIVDNLDGNIPKGLKMAVKVRFAESPEEKWKRLNDKGTTTEKWVKGSGKGKSKDANGIILPGQDAAGPYAAGALAPLVGATMPIGDGLANGFQFNMTGALQTAPGGLVPLLSPGELPLPGPPGQLPLPGPPGQLPPQGSLPLDRPLTISDGGPCLGAWMGTMPGTMPGIQVPSSPLDFSSSGCGMTLSTPPPPINDGGFGIKLLQEALEAAHALPSPKQASDKGVVYIKGLPADTTDLELYRMLAPFGPLSCARALWNDDGSCKGYGFANFLDATAAISAIQILNGTQMSNGATLQVVQKNMTRSIADVQEAVLAGDPEAAKQAIHSQIVLQDMQEMSLGQRPISIVPQQDSGIPMVCR